MTGIGKTKLIFVFLISGYIAHAIQVRKWQELADFGHIFIETEHKYNWFAAWNECAMRNMTLMAVDDPEKSSALTALLRKDSVKFNLWLGAHDMAEEGQFVWSATGQRFEFSNWCKGNPDNNNGVENCVLIWDATDYEWNDAACNQKWGFICEENRFVLAARRDLEMKRQFIDRLFSL